MQESHLSGPALAQAYAAQEKDLLRNQIDELLLVQQAKTLDIKVDSDVNRQIAQIQAQSGIVDPDKFHEYIHQQLGITFEEYKQRLTDRMLTQRLIGAEITSHINVPEADLRKYYDEHKADFVRKEEVFLSKILISTEGKTPEQVAAAEAKAKDIVARARKGEKFSALATANSDDPETARSGGQMPPAIRGTMYPQIEAIVFKENKGYVTDPIKVNEGFVILRIDERYDAGQASFDEVKDQIQEILAQPKMEPKLREYLTKLRQQAFLEIKDGYVDTGAAPGKDTRWHEVVGLKPETTTKEEVAAHRKRKRFLGLIPHGSVAPPTKETKPGATTPASVPAKNDPQPPATPPAAPIKQ
jgi:parvulin-like peptidyl-prolyl isomerase